MQTVIIVIHLMVVSAMIGPVLLQKSEGGGLGIATMLLEQFEGRL